MNINDAKNTITSNMGRSVLVTVYGMRNKRERYEGTLYRSYPNIFSIMTNRGEKSFSYNEYITGEVKIKYL